MRRQNIQEHLIRNLKDIEKEYDISLFQNSQKRFQKKYKRREIVLENWYEVA